MNPPEHDPTQPIVPVTPAPPVIPPASDAQAPKFGIPAWVPDPTAFVVPEAPVAALPSSATATPSGTAFPVGAPVRAAVAPGRRSNGLRPIIGIVGIVFVLFVAFKLIHHDPANPYETKADAITTAIINNNMKVVEPDFNSARLPELENHTQVGRLSDMLNALGAFKGSKEIKVAGTDAATHEFIETFEKGTQLEKYELDSDGKILRFHIGPMPSGMATP